MTLFKLGHVVGEDGADGSPGAKGDKGDKGDTGATGNGIQSIVLKSTSGKTKTYRITYTNGTTFDYEVKDGEDGSAASVDIVTSWSGTLSDAKVPSEKLSKNSLDAKAPTSHASSNNTYGLGTTSNYGHVKTINGLTQSSHSDGTALSAYQGKLLKDAIDAKADASSLATVATTGDYDDLTDKPSIPNKISDLQNDSDFIVTSSVIGLIKNDGTVDETSYLPASSYVPYYYATCSTGASTQDKALTITGFTLATGVVVVVKFSNENSYNGTARLKINSGTAIDIATVGTTKTSRYHWTAGEVITFVYDGTNFVMDSEGTATTTYYGVTKLSDSTSSTSTSLAATANAVKTAYDLAASKASVSDIPTDLSDLTDSTNLIPSKISDLTNDSDFIETSSTEGVIANDGSIIGIGTTQGTVAAGNHTHSNYISGTKVTSWSGSVSDSNIPSEKLVKNTLDDKISKSSTAGLIKNDGTIDTSTYLTQMKIGSTSGLPVKTGTNGVLAAGSFGTSAGTFAEGNHTHSNFFFLMIRRPPRSTPSDSNVPTEKLVKNSLPTKVSDLTNDSGFITSSAISGMLTSSDIADNLTTNDSTKVLSAKQGKALKDLIGAAITYINQ